MNGKVQSLLSYLLGIVGWLIAYFGGKEQRDDLSRYHLKQSLGLFIVNIVLSFAVMVLAMILVFISPELALIVNLIYILPLIWWIQGIINSIQEQKKPLLFIGKYFEDKFSFIDQN